MLRQRAHPPFVGRERELGVLCACLEAAQQGEGSVALLTGEPGIGKTRLLLALAERARAAGWLVLAGAADDAAGMPPYLPLVEAIRQLLLVCPSDELRAVLGSGAADIARLVPELRDSLPEVPPASFRPDADRYRLFESVTAFLLAVARAPAHAGLLLIVDDLHWADASTLLLLQHLARRLVNARILLVAAHRSTEREIGRPLAGFIAGLRRERLAETLSLSPLAAGETIALVEGIAGAVAPAVAGAIHRRTEGNPFFVEEVVRHLAGSGWELADPATAIADWGAPEGVRQVLGARLARLSPDTRRLLEAAAVLGSGAPIDLLDAITGLAPAALLDASDEATRAGMLREQGDGYEFAHALTRRTVYDGIGLARRQWLHRSAAEAIESLRGPDVQRHVAALALHYRLAGPAADAATARAYAQRAAEAAEEALAWEEAITHRQAALDLTPLDDQPARCELLLGLGKALFRGRNIDVSRPFFLEAARLARRLHLVDALVRAALGYSVSVDDETVTVAMALLEDALRAVSGEELGPRVALLSQLALTLWLRRDARAASVSRQAVELARRLGEPLPLARALSRQCQVIWGPDTAEQRAALTAEAARLCEEAGDRWLLAHILSDRRIATLLELGELRDVDIAIAACDRLARETGSPMMRDDVAMQHYTRALLAGRLAEAERLVEEANAVGWWGPTPFDLTYVRMRAFDLRRWQGRLAEMEEPVRQMSDVLARNRGNEHWRQALLYAEQGDREAARREVAWAAPDGVAALPKDFEWLAMAVHLAETFVLLPDREGAAALYEQLVPYAGRYAVEPALHTLAVIGFYGAVDGYLGLLAAALDRTAAAEGHFERAITLNVRVGARPWEARTRADYGALLLARGTREDLPRARSLLEDARAAFVEMGILHGAARAETLLEQARRRADGRRPAHPDGLTTREVQVLRLLAAGKSNREISDALVLSVRTVERHIENIYVKTGTHSRTRATLYAQEHCLP